MSPHIPTLLTRIWRYTRDEDISVRRVVVYFFLIAAIFYLLGAQYPKSDYRQLQNELKQARQENRLYADTIAKQKRAVIRESTQNRLNKKTLALLNERIDALLRENIRQKEKTLFYQQVFGNKALAGEMSIHHLEMSPDFTPQQWRLNAILVRQGKRKAFKGAYYFELVLMDGNGERTMRVPEDKRAFDMNLYYEAEEIVALKNESNIKKIRIVVLDAKNNMLASNELLDLGEQDGENVKREEDALVASPPATDG